MTVYEVHRVGDDDDIYWNITDLGEDIKSLLGTSRNGGVESLTIKWTNWGPAYEYRIKKSRYVYEYKTGHGWVADDDRWAGPIMDALKAYLDTLELGETVVSSKGRIWRKRKI